MNEITKYSKGININNDTLFLLNDIIETLHTDNNGIKLSFDDTSKLFSYKELNSNKEKDEYLKNGIKEITDKLNEGLEEIKKKAFFEKLFRKNENAELFYDINKFILEKCKTEKINLVEVNNFDENKDGLYFIIDKNYIKIKRQKENALILYSIVFNEFEDKFNINIRGEIVVNSSQDSFNIDETYPISMRGNILIVYNIQNIIKIFNLLYSDYRPENKITENKTKKDIDDYLSGRIKND
jgi:hypothetical protein